MYRCSTPAKSGMGSCGTYEIHEELILPHVLRMLSEEMGDIEKLLTAPPEELVAPGRKRQAERPGLKKERDKLSTRIENAIAALYETNSKETRQRIDQDVIRMRIELKQLDAELEVKQEPDYRREELQALADWWREFEKGTVSVPTMGKKLSPVAHFHHDPFSEEGALLIDARVVNEALVTLGAEIRLRWKTRCVKLRNGKQQNRYELIGGRFRLGQQTGKFAGNNPVSFRKAPVEAPSNGNRDADRCDNRKGRG